MHLKIKQKQLKKKKIELFFKKNSQSIYNRYKRSGNFGKKIKK